MMISPYAPLFPWLHDALGAQLISYKDGCRSASSYLTPYGIDLRNAQLRMAVLRCLHDVGHSRPWALGAPWFPLTDEQAGRACAETLRAVGEDPARPVGVVPVSVLDVWHLETNHFCGHRHRLVGVNASAFVSCIYGWSVKVGVDERKDCGPLVDPRQARLDALIPLANNAARALGCLMIEDLTP